MPTVNGGQAVALQHAAPFAGHPRAGMINEDSSHRLRGHREEVDAVVERDGLCAEQAHTELVDQRVRFERVVAAFVMEKARGDLAQLWMHDGEQLVAGAIVALAPNRVGLRYRSRACEP
jgi:hypothetical protein